MARAAPALAEAAAAADCTHIAWVASASNAAGMDFYRRLGAAVVHQAGDAVTLQIDPAELARTGGPAGPDAGPGSGSDE